MSTSQPWYKKIGQLFGSMQQPADAKRAHSPAAPIRTASVDIQKIVDMNASKAEKIEQWARARSGIEASSYRHLTKHDLEASSELEVHTYRNGWSFKRKEGFPLFYVYVPQSSGPNSLSLEYKCKSEEEWNEAEKMITEISAILGETICTPEELLQMRKGRMQAGRVIKEGDRTLSVQVDWKYVTLNF